MIPFFWRVFFFLSIAGLLQAKSYSIDSVLVRAEILPDGSMRVDETRSYNFDGTFRWADYNLDLRNFGRVSNVSVKEDGRTYTFNNSEEPGTFESEASEDAFYLKWHYLARNERRRFTLSFHLHDVVKRHKDIAELYYIFADERRPKATGYMHVEVILPQAAENSSDLYAWLTSPLFGKLQLKRDGLTAAAQNLHANTPFIIRFLFPQSMVNEIPAGPQLAFQKINDDEEERARERAEKREALLQSRDDKQKLQRTLLPWGYVLCSIAFVAFLFLYVRYGRGFDVNYNQSQDGQLPDLHPAIFSGRGHSNSVGGNSVSATLFELARKGYLVIETPEQSKKPKKFEIRLQRLEWEQKKNELAGFENSLLQFFFDELANGDVLSSEALKDERREVQKWYQGWSRELKEILKEQPFYDKQSAWATGYMAIIAAALFACGVTFVVTGGKQLAFVILAAIILFPLSFAILRMTPQGKKSYLRARALKRFIKEISPGNPMVYDSYDRYLVFAVALGMSEKHLKKIVEAVPAAERPRYFAWLPALAAGQIVDIDEAVFVGAIVAATSASVATSAGAATSAAAGGAAGGASGGAG